MLVSVHIPKTGGSSFKFILEQHFQHKLSTDYDDKVMKYSREENLAKSQEFNIAAKFPQTPVACIHGHFLAAKYKDIPDGRFCTWLRDPVERVVSRYHYGLKSRENRGISNTPDKPYPSTLEDFVKVEKFQNIYARYLQTMPISDFDFVGITEDYDESLVLFSEIFSIGLPEGTVFRNKNPLKKTCRYDISEKLRKEIMSLNSQDVEIYQQALDINTALKKSIKIL